MNVIPNEMPVGESVLERFEAGEIFIPIDELTWMDIKGPDRGKILSNITTNHVTALQVGFGCETFITDARGKAFGHGLVFAMEDRFRILTVADQYERLAAQIDRYVIREQIEVDDVSGKFHATFLPGVPGSKLAGQWQLPTQARPSLAFEVKQWGDLSATVYQVPWTTDGDWLIVVDKADSELLDAMLVEHDVLPGNITLMHGARIKHRYPWYGVDCDDSNLPQEMDRDDRTISFKKGCYLGQETIARLDALGQVQKKLMLWKFEGEHVPVRGLELTADGKTVATVTSSGYCFANRAPLALAMTRRSHLKPNSTASCELGNATVMEKS